MNSQKLDDILEAAHDTRRCFDKFESELVVLKGHFEAERVPFIEPVISTGNVGTTGDRLATPEELARLVNMAKAREGNLVQLCLYADRNKPGSVLCRLINTNEDGTWNCVLWGDGETKMFKVVNPAKAVWWWVIYRIVEAV